ncbi:Peptidase U62, modulator of DNA gyrase [Candidatus Sulfotelmatobacter kueseliae]|uniref:Peptidase U62, modulator of DNA gyrase n=1 Tax=Candidatus Sulfotelmatobacter kueseliae TaxID=2042962 RepID=A0A2U3L6N7_9BACT|nr:Peptidase U62, modulator of DNA gyrase [Candidatus Sulfotelmatobacter kueseliae]
MRQVANWALDMAARRGASYADARIVAQRSRALATKNGKVGSASDAESVGMSVRVIADGAWGFAASAKLDRGSVEATAGRAVEIARASARVKQHDVRLAPEKPVVAEWATPYRIDPFSVSVDENIALLLKIDAELRSVAGITLAETNLNFNREEQWFVSSEGADIHQTKLSAGAGYAAYAFAGNEIQKRSYPNSYGGQWQNKGYELIDELKLAENARRIAEEAVALHGADQCPEGKFDLILDSSQLGLQIHESIGHPIELDRVLGMEANFAGTSFLTLDKLRTLRYGSDLVNVVADARQEHGPGLGTFGFDDEGVPAQCTPIITNGLFTGYLSSRETAHTIGENRSGGTLRAEGWNRLPMIRMTNISLLPAEKPLSLEQLIAATEHGILMQTNRSWSIDDKRYNFQFGCEIGWEIKNGKRVRMLKNPSYSGITTEFWNSLDAICSRDEWTLWGTPNCGKGQPQQVMGTGHGAAPARFQGIKVGSAYKSS